MEGDSRGGLSHYELKRLKKIKENQALVSIIQPLLDPVKIMYCLKVSSIVSGGHKTGVTKKEDI